MGWLVLAFAGVALTAYFAPYALVERLAWRARADEVRVEKVPHWSVEKAYERWRLRAFVASGAKAGNTCGVFPFPSDNIFETASDADRALRGLRSGSHPHLLVAVPFFWVQCVEPSITKTSRTTALIASAAGAALIAVAAVLVLL
jgi:hypothetical protein